MDNGVPASPSHQLCLGELASWADVFPSAPPSLHLVRGDKFPHRSNEETGHPEVCRAKYAHVEVALRDGAGNPMRGVDMHPGGVALALEVYAVAGNRRLTDLDIPGHKGLIQRSLLLGPSNKPLVPEVTLTHASSHTFILKVNLLSSDIGMSEIYFRIVPTAPELAFNQNLIVCTPPFVSRARDPSDKKSYRPTRNVDFYKKRLSICKQRLRLSQQALAEAGGDFAVTSLRLMPEYQGHLSEDDSDSE
tara:strand:- start:597 stop:1340 length:744 start_codon:yes stop_codon:yes gene_type:complete